MKALIGSADGLIVVRLLTGIGDVGFLTGFFVGLYVVGLNAGGLFVLGIFAAGLDAAVGFLVGRRLSRDMGTALSSSSSFTICSFSRSC